MEHFTLATLGSLNIVVGSNKNISNHICFITLNGINFFRGLEQNNNSLNFLMASNTN